jgi:hypothetical protein
LVSQIQATIAPGDTALFACLPYQVTGLTVKSAAQVHAGQQLPLSVAVKASGTLGDHVFHAELVAPDGRTPWQYRYNRLAPAGKLNLSLPLALNDQPGRWTVKVRDVLTGTTGMATVRVLAPGN